MPSTKYYIWAHLVETLDEPGGQFIARFQQPARTLKQSITLARRYLRKQYPKAEVKQIQASVEPI